MTIIDIETASFKVGDRIEVLPVLVAVINSRYRVEQGQYRSEYIRIVYDSSYVMMTTIKENPEIAPIQMSV